MMKICLRKMLLQHRFTLSILSVLIIFQIVLSSIFPYFTKYIIDDVLLQHDLSKLRDILMIAIILILVQIPLNIGVSYYCSLWTQLIIYDLRQDISGKFLERKDNADENGLFINTITSDCELVGNQLLSIIVNGFPNLLVIFLYAAILLQLNIKLTIISLVIVPLYLLVSYMTSKKVFVLSKELQGNRDKLIEFLNSYVRNKLLIDLYKLNNTEKERFKTATQKVKNSNVKANTILSFFGNISGLISVVSPMIVLFIGSFMVIQKQLSLGTLIAFNSYISMLFTPLGKTLNILPMFSQMKASIERIETANYLKRNINTGLYSETTLSDNQQVKVRNFIPYVGEEPLLGTPLSFSIFKNQIIQIVGPNGVGKSIVLKTLINYFDNFSGCVEIQKDLNIVYVPQENFLFEGTIQENMTKGLSHYQETDISYLVDLLKFDLPLDTVVNPFNITLSSGQLQKIKLIRAFLSDPDVLLLDEAIANLDREILQRIIDFILEKSVSVVFVYHGDISSFFKYSEFEVLDLANYSPRCLL